MAKSEVCSPSVVLRKIKAHCGAGLQMSNREFFGAVFRSFLNQSGMVRCRSSIDDYMSGTAGLPPPLVRFYLAQPQKLTRDLRQLEGIVIDLWKLAEELRMLVAQDTSLSAQCKGVLQEKAIQQKQMDFVAPVLLFALRRGTKGG